MTAPNPPPQKMPASTGADAAAVAAPRGGPADASPLVVPVPATLAASTAANPLPPKPSLADIDKALADNLDVMLQKEVPIDAVLADVIEDKSALRQTTDAAPSAHNSNQPPRAGALDQPPPLSQSSAIAAPPAVADSQTVETSVNADHAPQQLASAETAESNNAEPAIDAAPAPPEDHAVAEGVAVVETAPINAVVESEPAQQPPAHLVIAAAVTEAPANHQPRQVKPPVHVPVGVGASAAIDVSPAPQPLVPRKQVVVRKLTSAGQPVVNILALINAPLRRVPAKFRRAIDWLAISLALWVPVVWVAAVMMSRTIDEHADGAHGPIVNKSESPDASVPAAMHDSSILKSH